MLSQMPIFLGRTYFFHTVRQQAASALGVGQCPLEAGVFAAIDSYLRQNITKLSIGHAMSSMIGHYFIDTDELAFTATNVPLISNAHRVDMPFVIYIFERIASRKPVLSHASRRLYATILHVSKTR